ncbi:putative transmembrane protein [Mycobacteroides abscessus subsp. massiliense]|uniref:YoaK family protein n=1 Tax=Mycobacteroides abscessus TaxID=36809 RepID=UPI0009A7AC2D|nr:YoaK family protein [Mycobacteroides abscessus]SKR01252.1 putative transmembrane protein [Mycobacteroides abscessus subsp. massiliense]SKR64009.1 putative transmembrane protein [Mycobacteroides abscessus subsp. massiliense]SKT47819.1 putative transmembrane protein [Mycobacteroides abscessus subsp. massiliense]SKT85425.1 putative transmembrane protein [Mycobacteroides abscessus subsp. massiliense]SLA27376.1 putative transmembrane protein [Mycobacteroides abscessus subsp. massiliense]
MAANPQNYYISKETAIGPEARLSWLLSALAGMIGAVAFLHSAGYFVTFMTGNSERAVLAWYPVSAEKHIAGAGPVAAILMIALFLLGVTVAAYCRRRFWKSHPHGTTVLTAVGLLAAAIVDFVREGFTDRDVSVGAMLIVAFSVGTLNTSFCKKGEVSIPLSYVTGTLVKMGQGLERHMFGGGSIYDWLTYVTLYAAFLFGAAVGGVLGSVTTGPQTLLAAGLLCAGTAIITFFRTDRKDRVKNRLDMLFGDRMPRHGQDR